MSADNVATPLGCDARQRLKDNGLNSRFDASSKTYQCNSCAGAERLNASQEKMIQDFLKEKYPEVDRKIRSGNKRRRLFSLYYAELNPKFKPTREAQERGRRNLAGKSSQAKTKANLIRRWSAPALPKRIRFGICIVCDKIQMTYDRKEPRFHWSCHQKWESTPEGRRFQSQRVGERRQSFQHLKSVVDVLLKTA